MPRVPAVGVCCCQKVDLAKGQVTNRCFPRGGSLGLGSKGGGGYECQGSEESVNHGGEYFDCIFQDCSFLTELSRASPFSSAANSPVRLACLGEILSHEITA